MAKQPVPTLADVTSEDMTRLAEYLLDNQFCDWPSPYKLIELDKLIELGLPPYLVQDDNGIEPELWQVFDEIAGQCPLDGDCGECMWVRASEVPLAFISLQMWGRAGGGYSDAIALRICTTVFEDDDDMGDVDGA